MISSFPILPFWGIIPFIALSQTRLPDKDVLGTPVCSFGTMLSTLFRRWGFSAFSSPPFYFGVLDTWWRGCREISTPEAQFPRTPLLGNTVNKVCQTQAP